jgi:hypothetical protein
MTTLSKELLEYAYSVCPERRELFEQFYVSSFDRVAHCLGPALCESRIPGTLHREQPVSHVNVALSVAAQSVFIITADSSYRAWQQAQSSGITAIWSRAMWRFALTLPLGYVVSRHSVRVNTNSPTWNPALQDLPEYTNGPAFNVLDSARSLAASTISFATYYRLFAEDIPTDPMLSFALADAFCATPNPDNPLAGAFRRALHKVVAPHRHLRYPYWWVLLHNEQLAHRDDFRPLHINAPAAGAPPTSPPAPTANRPSRSFPVPAQPNPALSDSNAAAADLSESPADAPDPDPVALAALEVARSCIDQKIFLVNCKGALFHVLDGALHLVVPAGWDRLAAQMQRPGLDGQRLESLMMSSGLVFPDPTSRQFRIRAEFRPANNGPAVGVTTLSRLSDSATAVICPAGIAFPDNPTLVPLSAA